MPGETPRDEVATTGEAAYVDGFEDDDDGDDGPGQGSVTRPGVYDDDDDDYDDDKEIAEMFAKVQSIQQAENFHVVPVTIKPPPATEPEYAQLQVTIPSTSTMSGSKRQVTPVSSGSSIRSRSPPGSAATKTRSPDGIKTISRRDVASTDMDVLSGVKKPALFQNQLLQAVKQRPETLEQLKQQVAAAAPGKIARRVESLSEPKRSDTGRRFANDDDEKHCRFRVKKRQSGGKSRDAYDDDDGGGAGDKTGDFIARMEAAERNRQKKLELTRGEQEYLANLNKKVCPKCQIPQSYSEYRDKKKWCQGCGSEFRVLQAWGDVGSQFISRISEDSQQRHQRKEQIKAEVTHAEMNANRTKSATQQYYEKTLQQRDEHKTFLDRNYTTTSAKRTITSVSEEKTKRAQAQLHAQLQAQRAKLLAAAQPPIF